VEEVDARALKLLAGMLDDLMVNGIDELDKNWLTGLWGHGAIVAKRT